MKKEIHPDYKEITVKCTCGATFEVMSTEKNINLEVCSQCHPFFTGAKRFIDTSGRVDKFQKRYKGWDAKKELEKSEKKK